MGRDAQVEFAVSALYSLGLAVAVVVEVDETLHCIEIGYRSDLRARCDALAVEVENLEIGTRLVVDAATRGTFNSLAFPPENQVVEDGVNGALVSADTAHGEAEVEAFAKALLRVSEMKFGDLRAAALDKFSFERMIRSTKEVYLELARARGQ